jgi:hypothetical protein
MVLLNPLDLTGNVEWEKRIGHAETEGDKKVGQNQVPIGSDSSRLS